MMTFNEPGRLIAQERSGARVSNHKSSLPLSPISPFEILVSRLDTRRSHLSYDLRLLPFLEMAISPQLLALRHRIVWLRMPHVENKARSVTTEQFKRQLLDRRNSY